MSCPFVSLVWAVDIGRRRERDGMKRRDKGTGQTDCSLKQRVSMPTSLNRSKENVSPIPSQQVCRKVNSCSRTNVTSYTYWHIRVACTCNEPIVLRTTCIYLHPGKQRWGRFSIKESVTVSGKRMFLSDNCVGGAVFLGSGHERCSSNISCEWDSLIPVSGDLVPRERKPSKG